MGLKSKSSALRRITLALSLFSVHLLEDPNDLFAKVSQKLRGKGFPVPALKISSPNLQAEKLFEIGELSRSAQLFQESGFRGRSRARKIRRQLAEFAVPIKPSARLSQNLERINVLFYLTNSKPFTESGYTERTHQLLKALKDNGANVRGVTRLGYPVVIGAFPLYEETIVDGIEYVRLLPERFPKEKSEQIALAVQMLVDEARKFDATILHTTTDFKNAIVVSQAAEILGIPWVYETRGELQKTWLSKRPVEDQTQAMSSEFYKAASFNELEAMKSAAKVVQLSQVSQSNAVVQGVPKENTIIVPNAVSSAEVGRNNSQSRVRQELGLPEGQKIVGAVTSIVQYEGLDDLIRAVSILPDVVCLIVGGGEARPKLDLLVSNLGIQDRVHFVGKKPSGDIWKWYLALDIFITPRKDQEVCRTVTPIKTLLAQANGVPVIASDLPALREVTGGSAFYVPPESPEELAKTIDRVLTCSPEKLSEVRQRSLEWVSTRTWDANACRLIDLYKQR